MVRTANVSFRNVALAHPLGAGCVFNFKKLFYIKLLYKVLYTNFVLQLFYRNKFLFLAALGLLAAHELSLVGARRATL